MKLYQDYLGDKAGSCSDVFDNSSADCLTYFNENTQSCTDAYNSIFVECAKNSEIDLKMLVRLIVEPGQKLQQDQLQI